MSKFDISTVLMVMAAASGSAWAATDTANEQSNLLNDQLTVSEAQGRFDWLEKCYDGVLVELWEQSFAQTGVFSKAQKLAQLRQQWLSDAQVAAGRAQYLTFANSDFSNPYQWRAGTAANQPCSTMPPEYKAVALNTTLLKHSYCANQSYDHEWEWLAGVRVGEFGQQTDSAAYTLVSGKVATLPANRTISVTLTPGNKEPDFPSQVGMRVWIDWDQDGQFSSSELVYKTVTEQAVTFNLAVPANAAEGVTLMRVASDAGGGSDNACKRVSYGEVEDYLVTVH